MKQTTAFLFSTYSLLPWWGWLLIFLGILLFILLLVLLLRPVMTKRKQRKIAEQNTELQQKDLMAWQNIAGMAADQTESETVKQSLASKLKSVRRLFGLGMGLLRKSGRLRFGVPWFILLGEPRSGKSELMEKSDLSMKCSAAEAEGDEESLPLRFWLGRSMVLDVSGRIFFDRWFHGSCAEWNMICKLILKKHYRVPLNGIILTIPADALISDSEELTKRKVSLIAAEMNQLLAVIGMVLPCYVVVTKLDMVLGFQEYFHGADPQQCEKVWGWRNSLKTGLFDASGFSDYWNSLTEKLREGSLPLLLQGSGTEKRMDSGSGVYLFPDEFHRIHRNLIVYLNNLFGQRSWMDGDSAKIAGVYFTSSRCGHNMLSADFAKQQKKEVEDAVLVNRTAGPQHSFFVKELLEDLIFSNAGSFSFTAGGRFRRNLGKYVLCLVMAAVAVFLALKAWHNNDGGIRIVFESRTLFYNKTAVLFNENALEKSPLVLYSPDKNISLVPQTDPIAGHNDLSRLLYFHESQQIPARSCTLPWGFKVSQFALFRDFNCNRDKQDFVSARVHMEMVFKPLLQLVVQYLLTDRAGKEPFTEAKRDVFLEMRRLKNVWSPDKEKFVDRPLRIAPYIRYLHPETPAEIVALLDWRAGKLSDPDINEITEIVSRFNYQKASLEITKQFLAAWMELDIYPKGEYGLLRTIIRSAEQSFKNHARVHTLAQAAEKDPHSMQTIADFHALVEEQNQRIINVSRAMTCYNLAEALIPQLKSTDKPSGKNRNSVQDIFNRFEKRLEEDFDLIQTLGVPEAYSAVQQPSASFQDTENSDPLKLFQYRAQRLLAIEKDELMAKLTRLQESTFILPALPEQGKDKPSDNVAVGVVQHELMLLVVKPWKKDREKLKSPADFAARGPLIQKKRDDCERAFNEYAARYAPNPILAAFIKDCRILMKAQGICMKDALLKELFAFYPDSSEEFIGVLSSGTKLGPETVGMKPELAKESFGTLEIPGYYDPQTVKVYTDPIARVITANKGGKGNSLNAEQQKEIDRIVRMLNTYLGSYIQYWETFTDKIPIAFSSWEAFRKEAMVRKSYQTNTLLLASYLRCRDYIQQIPDSVLTEETAARKKAALGVLNRRVQILSPDFAQSCAKVCSSWALLPSGAEAAFGILHNLPKRQLMTDYLLVLDTGAKGDIPWWSRWVKCGVSLLYRDAKAQLYKEFSRYQPVLFSFPLCRKSPYSSVSGEGELTELSQYLTALGCPVITQDEPKPKTDPAKGKKDDASVAADARQFAEQEAMEQLFGQNPEYIREWKNWGGKMQILLDSLLNKVKPLTYTLMIPGEAEQKNLSARLPKPMPLAVYRFPCLRVSGQLDDREQQEVRLSGSATPELLSGLVSSSCLKLDFCSFSGQEKPDCTVAYVCKWAVLKLYLSDWSSYDPKTKTVYSALILPDQSGKEYVMWIGFKFNKQIPLPSEWPSTQNCPNFSTIQTALQRKSLTEKQWLQEIGKALPGQKGYDALVKLIRQYPAEHFPVFRITPTRAMEKSLLETPYLEVGTPGRSERVLWTESAKGIPVDLESHLLEIRLFRFAGDKVPAYSATVKGPYAVLRLLTWKDREMKDGHPVISLDMLSPNGRQHFIMKAELLPGR